MRKINKNRFFIGGFAFGPLTFPAAWISEYLGNESISGFVNAPMSLFVFGFAVPMSIIFIVIFFKNYSVIEYDENSIVLIGGFFQNKKCSINVANVLNITTEWEGPNTYSPNNIIFHVNETEYQSIFKSGIFYENTPCILKFHTHLASQNPNQIIANLPTAKS
jgi:hypothetical protein